MFALLVVLGIKEEFFACIALKTILVLEILLIFISFLWYHSVNQLGDLTHVCFSAQSQPLLQAHRNQQGWIHLSRASLNISQRAGRGALPSAWTMDRLAWHRAGNEYQRHTALAELQLVQRLSSLPSGKCFTELYLTNAGKAIGFPYQAVRVPFDEMRRYRVTNLPRGRRWGVSKSRPSGLHRQNQNKTATDFSAGFPTSTRAVWSRAAQTAPGWKEGAGERPINLKAISYNLHRGEGQLNFSPKPPIKKQMSQKHKHKATSRKKERK